MSSNAKKAVAVTRTKADALQARKELVAEGGIVPMWQLPRMVGSTGPIPVFETPEELWDAAYHYFLWSENNPVEYEIDIRVGGAVQMVTTKKRRPFHIRAFFFFAGISKRMWDRLCGIEEFEDTIEEIESIIFTQIFDQAMVGVFDSSMSSKVLGFADKREISGPEGGPINLDTVKESLRARLLKGKEEMK